jgi:hypothetical protein
MSRFSAHYAVARATGVCAHSGRPLEPGTTCIATLCERETDEGFDRLDYSIEAWESGARPQGLFSFWKTIVPDPNTKKKLLVDDDVLRDLFERMEGDDRPQRIAFRFVLGLILMRKRLIKLVGRKAKSGEQPERWLILPKGLSADATPMEMVNPELNDDDVRELSEQLSEVLNSDLGDE